MSGNADLGGFHEVTGLTNLFGDAESLRDSVKRATRAQAKANKPAATKSPVRVAAGKKAARTRVPFVRGHVVLKSDPSKYVIRAEKSAAAFRNTGLGEVLMPTHRPPSRLTNLGELSPDTHQERTAEERQLVSFVGAYERRVEQRRHRNRRSR